MDQAAFVARIEASDPGEFAQLLTRPSVDEERVLRRYFGDERYRRLHELALLRPRRGETERPLGHVVVIPDVFQSELFTFDDDHRHDLLWLSPERLIDGDLSRLRLAGDGRSPDDPDDNVRPGGAMKRVYGELILTLVDRANVLVFAYDWRKDVQQSADALAGQITAWLGDDAAFHLVAHGLGGLVARTFVARHLQRWRSNSTAGAKSGKPTGGRLVMLGTPNHGAYAAVRSLVGLDAFVRRLEVLDRRRDQVELLKILSSFPALYQMLPSPFKPANGDAFYDPDIYGPLPVSQTHLYAAKERYLRLNTATTGKGQIAVTADPARMVCIAGYGYRTPIGIDLSLPLTTEEAYRWAEGAGDGVVPHTLVRLQAPNRPPVPAFYVEGHHADLPANRAVLAALDDLLLENLDPLAVELPTGLVADQPPSEPVMTDQIALKTTTEATARETFRLEQVAEGLRNRGRNVRGAGTDEAAASVSSTPDEVREITDAVLRGSTASLSRSVRSAPGQAPPIPSIELRIVHNTIEATNGIDTPDLPIDVIAVGHYVGLRPQAAVQAVDEAISKALLGDDAPPLRPDQRLLTQYADRGTLTGELGQLFFLPDPRDKEGRRLIAVVGMGLPGRFGAPELVVLVRELCWVVGRFGKRHLATTLIGSGNGNLSVNDAVYGWSRGIMAALQGAAGENGDLCLTRVTFVHNNPKRVLEIDSALSRVAQELRREERLVIFDSAAKPGAEGRRPFYAPFASKRRDELEKAAERQAVQDLRDQLARVRAEQHRRTGFPATAGDEDPVPTRLTLGVDDSGYRFSIMTETAAVPERVTTIDKTLVLTANGELASEEDLDRQEERGKFLGRLIVPTELRPHFAGDAPVVMVLDRTTARIHWEMVAQPDPLSPVGLSELLPAEADADEASIGGTASATPSDAPPAGPVSSSTAAKPSFDVDRFLGTARGFTRQLRTAFAPPPEPPPPHRRVLRVLIVADPAPDASLEGAEREGATLLQLFDTYNRLPPPNKEQHPNSVKVVSLFGPTDATRTKVLEELINNRYDLLHFAGHCWFDEEHPSACGWLFRERPRECLSANELNRIDRIPKFVFSNACQSGVTPLQSVTTAAGLAPSFAESFFNRGVDNFVCTAWKVNDLAGLEFAVRLYERLLGLRQNEQTTKYERSDTPWPMWAAMRDARAKVANMPEGTLTWGAYQHYGNPFYRMFAPGKPPMPSDE